MSAKTPEPENKPIAQSPVEWVLVIGAFATVALVTVWFALDVNRVFDVPKATALKIGGSLLLLLFLVYGSYGRGFAYSGLRLFVAPVFAMALAVIVSTALSIDVATSVFGVYERQFGLQGFLGCVGVFVATAAGLRSKRGAVFGLAWLALVAGLMGSYAFLQARGHDPFPFFFKKPNDKVYSFLGNATFAGNALALAFPVSAVLAVVAALQTTKSAHFDGKKSGWLFLLIGALVMLAFEVGVGWWAARPDTPFDEVRRASAYKFGVGLSFFYALGLAGFGSYGPEALQLGSERSRRAADAMAAGCLLLSAFGIGLGVVVTRTRGAWVGTSAAFAALLLLLPFLLARRGASEDPAGAASPEQKARLLRLLLICGGLLAVSTVLTSLWVMKAESLCEKDSHCLLYARTIRSIPAAFDTSRYLGKGQGTRPFLWKESPRVMTEHAATLERLYDDRADMAAGLKLGNIEGLELSAPEALSEADRSFDTAWRTKLVYLFGIGIETYRFAFMSHKSKALEARDPMTNHDNPHNNYLYVLASFGILGLLAYLWLLFRLLGVSLGRFLGWKVASSSVDRQIALGVVLSFFSYAFYSMGGFDSVCCSVYLFFLLGCAAAYFEPSHAANLQSLPVAVQRHFLEWRAKGPLQGAPKAPPAWLPAILLVPCVLFLGYSVISANTIYSAEQAFVHVDETARTRSAYMEAKLEGIKEAIRLHPYESYYKQSLGNAYADAARGYMGEASRAAREGRNDEARNFLATSEGFEKKAEIALYAALSHAWAPENVFISLFQLYYSSRRYTEAERALTRGLVHSPHLGAVRANLAVLKLERKAYAEALADALWVIEVDKRSPVAFRTAGRCYSVMGELGLARSNLERAQKMFPRDPATAQYLTELEALERSKTASATGQSPR